MKTFIYEFHGIWLGGSMYIRAKDQEDANKMFKDELEELGQDIWSKNTLTNGDIDASAVTITKVPPGRSSFVIDNGDY